jgi:hypothetical protein
MGAFSRLTAVTSWRMPADIREQLERSRKARSRRLRKPISLGQELLYRLRNSFDREQDEARDPAMRALNFLFSELVERIHFGVEPNWRSHPFLFRAFKLATAKLLDALEPSGQVDAPPDSLLRVLKIETDPNMAEWLAQMARSPKAMADQAVSFILLSYRNPSPVLFQTLEKGIESRQSRHRRQHDRDIERALAGVMTPEEIATQLEVRRRELLNSQLTSLKHSYYGMVHAKRDLAVKPKPQGEKS